MFQRRTIEVETPTGKGQVALVEFGDPARPVDVVFSHANGFNAYTYRSILDPLAADLRVVAYDLRGHGRTTLPVPTEARPDWWDLCDDLLAVMDALALEKPVVLAGHSFGATVSLMAAQRRPTRHPQGERAPFVQAASVTPPLMPMVDRALRPSPLRTMASHAIVRAPLALLRSSPAVWRALEMSMSMSLREPPDT